MGLFNTYGGRMVQMKVSDDLHMKHFNVGDKVDVGDGVYLGDEGVIVVKDGVLIAEFENLITKWGNEVSPEEILRPYDVVAHIVERTIEELRKMSSERE